LYLELRFVSPRKHAVALLQIKSFSNALIIVTCFRGLVNRFIGSSLIITTISSYTLKITVTIAHVTSHTKFSNSFFGHTAVPLELRNSSEVNSHSHILSYPLGTDHAQKTQFYCCVAQTTQETSHVITFSPVHWRSDCCLVTSYKHSSYCCVFIAPLPSYTRYIILLLILRTKRKPIKAFHG
jgi:hypothetical protein